MKFSIFCLALLSLFAIACGKSKHPPISQDDMWKCHHAETWDSLKTANTLIGEWDWEYVACFFSPDGASYDEFKGLSLEFKSDNTLNIREDGHISQTVDWALANGSGGTDLFTLSLSEPVSQLYGTILICDENIEFNHSYIDGCDNYFERRH